VTATTSRRNTPFSLSLDATADQEEEDGTTNRDADLLIIEKASATSDPAIDPPWIESA
jgi:hypothetical protein